MTKNPWKYGDINEAIVKAYDIGAPSIAKAFEIVREILKSVDSLESEGPRKQAARKASENFRKEIENE
jgi:hypothetical protein